MLSVYKPYIKQNFKKVTDLENDELYKTSLQFFYKPMMEKWVLFAIPWQKS